MNDTHNPKLTPCARDLRKNMTKEERKLWYEFLRKLSCKVHRQFVIGNYIVDFFCSSANLIIELDGSQHYTNEKHMEDLERDQYLLSLGYTVLRYSNYQIHRDFVAVKQDIWNHIFECPAK